MARIFLLYIIVDKFIKKSLPPALLIRDGQKWFIHIILILINNVIIMAIVNIDLSEYDAIRNRNRELEEQVKELKKVNIDNVRLEAEDEKRKEVERIFNSYKQKYESLKEDFEKKRIELEESCKKKLLEENNKMRDEYLNSFKAKEAHISALTGKLEFINSYAKTAFCIAENSIFMSKKVERLLKSIRDISEKL